MATPSSRPLSGAQAGHFQRTLALLQSGATAQALSDAERLVAQASGAADAWQLLGMCLAGAGRQAEAGDAFEQALVLSPGNVEVSRNYGVCLAGHGKALRAQGVPDAAEPVLRKALGLAPTLVSAWVDLGVVLRLLGRPDEALAAFQRADDMMAQRGIEQADVQDAINGVLVDAGRTAEALAGARQLVARRPDHAPAHETLSRLLWENGAALAPGEDPLEGFRKAARSQPGNRALHLALARLMISTGSSEDALAILHPLRAREPGNAVLDWFAADALDALRQHEKAAALYASAAGGGLGELPEFLNAHARHALRTRRFDLAERCAGKAVAIDPRNQEGWSHLGTAWRLAGDAREDWLFDYERLVGDVEVAVPPGFADQAGFLRALAATLDAMHTAGRAPVGQSVRGGTQTTGQLFGRDDTVIRAAEHALREAVQSWLAALPDDPAHPFLSRKTRSVRFTGSWSVRLTASGRHASHIHPMGWASSAFYVGLPDSVQETDSTSRAGWIQFGQPLETLGLDLPPSHFVRPRPGHVVLFPSYMWHGTVPFADAQPRLTVAFDMQPGV